jgi:hypothetical protein
MPKVVGTCNSFSTGSSLSESSSWEAGVNYLELRMAEQARSQQASSAGRVGGKARFNSGMVQQVFRCSRWPEFKFAFSNAKTEWNSDLAKAYTITPAWTYEGTLTDLNIGQRQCLSGEGPSMINDPV